jgi:xylose isomerase
VLQGGGLTTGGLNFDAKVRRQSIDAADLFHGHIGGEKMVNDGRLKMDTAAQTCAADRRSQR